MAILKCKMCGGDLQIAEGVTVGKCEFCGTRQTWPKTSDEGIQNLFNRANNLRIQCEFDKAELVYEKILQQNNQEAEAHWGMVLCKYGIEYVVDPKTSQRVPTCHRTSFDAVTADPEYLAAIANADTQQKVLYEAEAKVIDGIQKNILNIVKNEKPFDVFICYKETDENDKRTQDSAIANDIYHQLTQEGLKVFYAAITLEDKLGQAYEPYIFAALNSAKVMLVIGTKPQYFTGVWVKNEWSRFLKLMKTDRNKLLIPCYKDMGAYDLPEEFSHLQAQDMSKIGFINDVVRGIRKVLTNTAPKTAAVQDPVVTNTAPLLQRAFMFLEDGDWARADEFCEQVLNQDPQNAGAYLGKLMAQLKVKQKESLKNCAQPFDNNNNYQKILRFGDDQLVAEVTSYVNHIKERNENTRLEGIYSNAKRKMDVATEAAYLEAALLLETIPQYKDAAELAKICRDQAEQVRLEGIYSNAKRKMDAATERSYLEAAQIFETIPQYQDASTLAQSCRDQAEAERLRKEQEAILLKQKAKKMATIVGVTSLATIAIVLLFIFLIIPSIKYSQAVSMMESGNKVGAAMAFAKAGNIKDAKSQCSALWNDIAVRNTISAGGTHTVGLKTDGTVVAVGDNDYNQCKVSDWKDIVAISAGGSHTVGLKTDGAVVAVGYNDFDQCNVSRWTDIVAISAGSYHTVGLKSDGTVVAVGRNYNNQCNVSQWTDIVAISAGGRHTVGLKKDGTVVAVGSNDYDQCNVSQWTDIVAISAGADHTVGLKKDGTVVAVGNNSSGQRKVSRWTDIVAISAGFHHTVGLKKDGTVVAVGRNTYDQCNVSDWKNIKLP